MVKPTQCRLWKDSDWEKGPLKEKFELLHTYFEDENWWRYLLKCRECGQLYFLEFKEETDWKGGNDPQFTVYIPVESAEEAKTLSHKSPADLRTVTPRLQKDWPEDEKRPRISWISK